MARDQFLSGEEEPGNEVGIFWAGVSVDIVSLISGEGGGGRVDTYHKNVVVNLSDLWGDNCPHSPPPPPPLGTAL